MLKRIRERRDKKDPKLLENILFHTYFFVNVIFILNFFIQKCDINKGDRGIKRVILHLENPFPTFVI